MPLQHYQTMYIAQWQYDWHYDAMAKSPWHSDHDSMKLWLSLRRSDDYVDMATAMATTTITTTTVTVTTLMVITMMACMNVIEGSKGKIRKGLEVEEDNAKIR